MEVGEEPALPYPPIPAGPPTRLCRALALGAKGVRGSKEECPSPSWPGGAFQPRNSLGLDPSPGTQAEPR